MRNYISVNAKHYKRKEINRISEHNFRLQKIGYLLKKEYIEYKNVDIIYENNITNKDIKNLVKVGQYKNNLNNFFNKKQLDMILKLQYQQLLKEKENIQYKNKSYTKTNESTLVEMVVALSEEQAKDYLEQGKDLGLGFDNFTKNICEKYGFTPLQVSVHYDEGYVENGQIKNNIHAHVTLFNYDFKKQKSVLRTLKKQDYKELQDLASQSFQEVGFNFVRGISKELSGKEHLEQNDYILQKQKNEIGLNNLIIEQQNQQLNTIIKNINKAKLDSLNLLKTIEKNTLEYKTLFIKIGKLKQDEKNLRESSKKLKEALTIGQQYTNGMKHLREKEKKFYENVAKDTIKRIEQVEETKYDFDR